MESNKLGRAIARVRDQKKLTQYKLAVKTGWSNENDKQGLNPIAIHGIEHGEWAETIEHTNLIAKALGTTRDELLRIAETTKPYPYQ